MFQPPVGYARSALRRHAKIRASEEDGPAVLLVAARSAPHGGGWVTARADKAETVFLPATRVKHVVTCRS